MVSKENIAEINEGIRKQLSAGASMETVTKPFSGYEGFDPRHILASLAVSESYDMEPAEAMTMSSSLFAQTHGKDYDLDQIVTDYFASPKDFELPYKHKTLADFNAEIQREEAEKTEEYKKRPPNPLMKMYSFGGFNQAMLISPALQRQAYDKTWFSDDAQEKFIKGILNAETEEQKESLRQERLKSLIDEQAGRLQKLRDFERKRKAMFEDSPGFWLSKWFAGARGVSKLRMTSYQAAGDFFETLGKITSSGNIRQFGKDMNLMARAYWKAMQEPEVSPMAVNGYDRAVNSFLENVPHVGLTVLESIVAPPLSPAFVYFNCAALEGTAIRQQCLDAGKSDRQARTRGWIGGAINGFFEMSGGGAVKYSPKKLVTRIARFPGVLTNNVLKEIFMEEFPQEYVSMMMTGDVPYTPEGELDWDEITNRFISLAGDTAFASAMFTAGGSAIGEYNQWSTKRRVNKQFAHDVQIVMDQINTELSETGPETDVGEKIPLIGKQGAEISKDLPVMEEVDLTRQLSPEAKKKHEELMAARDNVTVEVVSENPEIDEMLEDTPAYGIVEQYAAPVEESWTVKKVGTKTARTDLTFATQEEAQQYMNKHGLRTEYELIHTEAAEGQPSGKFAVIDWDTQREIKTGLTKKQAIGYMNEYNSGRMEVPVNRARDVLPTSQDMETLSHRQLLNVVFRKVSQQSRKIVQEVTNSIIQAKKNLVNYARDRLEKLDVTEAQRNTLLRKAALALTDTEKSDFVSTVEGIREISRKKKAMDEHKKIRRLINKSARQSMSSGGIHYKVYDTLKELLDNYTTLSPKILNSIKRTQTYLDNLRENAAEKYSAEYAEGLIPKSVIGKFQELAATPLNEMTAYEIEQLNDSVKHLLKMSQLWNKLLEGRKAREAKQFLDNAVGTMKLEKKPARTKRLRPKRGKLKQVWDAFLGYRNDDAYTLFSRIWGKFDPLTNRLLEMRNGQLSVELQLKDMITDYMNKLGVTMSQLKRWSPAMQFSHISQAMKERFHTSADLYTVNIGGTDRQFFMSEIMSLYMHTKSNYNLSKVVKNGIGTYDQGIIGKITSEEFNELLGILENDPVAKAFCDKLSEFYLFTAELGNKVSRRLDGIDWFKEEDYFHIEYVREGGVIGAEYVRDAIVDEEGRLKPRTSSNRPVILRDVFEVMAEDIFVMSHFVGMTEQLRMLRSLVNYGPFREKMRSAHAEYILDAIDEETGAIQRTRRTPSSAFEKAIQRLGRGAARASLTMPNVWLYQPTSCLLYMTETSGKYLASLPTRIGVRMEKDLLENWALYRSRKEGIAGSKSIGMKSSVRRLFTGKMNAADIQLAGLHRGDMFGVSRAAIVTQREMADTGMRDRSLRWWKNYGVDPTSLEYGSEQYWQAFRARADYLVSLTQPMFFSENKGEYANSDNAIVREAARFRSFVDQILRIFHRQYSFVAKGDISKSEALHNMALAYMVMALTKSIIKFGWDRLVMGKDKELEELFADIAVAPFQLVPFMGYPASAIVKMGMGFGWKGESPSYSIMATMLIDNILEHSWDVAKGFHYLTDDEYFQSGPNRGRLKSEFYIKRGLKGAFQDYLVMQGVPAYAVDQVKWWKD